MDAIRLGGEPGPVEQVKRTSSLSEPAASLAPPEDATDWTQQPAALQQGLAVTWNVSWTGHGRCATARQRGNRDAWRSESCDVGTRIRDATRELRLALRTMRCHPWRDGFELLIVQPGHSWPRARTS